MSTTFLQYIVLLFRAHLDYPADAMKKPKTDKQDSTLSIRINSGDLLLIKNAAKAKRRPMALWVREACLHVAATQK
jgi:hypothetical protein